MENNHYRKRIALKLVLRHEQQCLREYSFDNLGAHTLFNDD